MLRYLYIDWVLWTSNADVQWRLSSHQAKAKFIIENDNNISCVTQCGWISAIVQYIWCGVDSNVSKRGLVFVSCMRPCGGLVIARVTVWGLIIRLLRRFAVQSIRCDLLLLVCVSVGRNREPKNGWTFKMRFEVWTSVGPRNHLLGWGPDPPGEGAILGRYHPENCKVYGISCVCHSYLTAATLSSPICQDYGIETLEVLVFTKLIFSTVDWLDSFSIRTDSTNSWPLLILLNLNYFDIFKF